MVRLRLRAKVAPKRKTKHSKRDRQHHLPVCLCKSENYPYKNVHCDEAECISKQIKFLLSDEEFHDDVFKWENDPNVRFSLAIWFKFVEIQ